MTLSCKGNQDLNKPWQMKCLAKLFNFPWGCNYVMAENRLIRID